MSVIFDLDNTLIDSSIAFNLRKERKWNEVYKKIPYFKIYDGIYELIKFLNEDNIEIVIVTSSPRNYCEKILKEFNIPIENCICYHDTKFHKPSPEPILKAKKLIKNQEHILSFGDDIKDIMASKSANIISVACLWGSSNPELLKNSNADYICETVEEMKNLIKEFHKI